MVDVVTDPASSKRSNAILCPNCRRLVSADEPKCPHCGLPTPGSRWKQSRIVKGMDSEQGLLTTIIALNVIMYLITLLMSRGGLRLSGNPMYFLSPDNGALLRLGATGTFPIDQYHRWWTLVSASYLHGGILHIAFNMLALRQVAPLVMREYGNHRMFIIYSLSGVAGFLLSYYAGVSRTIGASAAVCGLIGAALYYGKSRGGVYGQAIYRQVGGWVIGIVLFGVMVPGINNWAHGGGMVAGILLSMLMGYHERRKERFFHRWLAGLCMVTTVGVLMWSVFMALFYRL